MSIIILSRKSGEQTKIINTYEDKKLGILSLFHNLIMQGILADEMIKDICEIHRIYSDEVKRLK